MSIYILRPTLVNEVVIKIYEYMTICEMKKILGHLPQIQSGQQDGYLRCLIDLFSSENLDHSLERVFGKKQTDHAWDH